MKKRFNRFLCAMITFALLTTPVAFMEEGQELQANYAVDSDVLDNQESNTTIEPAEEVSTNTDEVGSEKAGSEEDTIDYIGDIQPDSVDPVVMESDDVNLEDDTPETVEEDLDTDDEVSVDCDMEAQSITEQDAANMLLEGNFEGQLSISGIIPDVNFRQYVIDHFDNNPKNGILSPEEVANIKRIALLEDGYGPKGTRGENISSLQGIEYFTELTFLECYWVGLTSLDISKNTKLTYLNCSMNEIKTLDVSKNTALTVLGCWGNMIGSLDISNLSGILACVKGKNSYSVQYTNEDSYIAYTGNLQNLAEDRDRIWDLTGSFLGYDTSTKLVTNNPTSVSNDTLNNTSTTSSTTNTADSETPIFLPGTRRSNRVTITAAPGTYCGIDMDNAIGRKFKSSRKKVATVDSTGLVMIKGAGTTKISFKVGRKKRTIKLTVKDPTVPTSVQLKMTNANPINAGGIYVVKVGDVINLSAILPAGTNSGIKWKSNKKKVAKVTNGVVTFKKTGKVTITAICTRGKKKASIKFRIGK